MCTWSPSPDTSEVTRKMAEPGMMETLGRWLSEGYKEDLSDRALPQWTAAWRGILACVGRVEAGELRWEKH